MSRIEFMSPVNWREFLEAFRSAGFDFAYLAALPKLDRKTIKEYVLVTGEYDDDDNRPAFPEFLAATIAYLTELLESVPSEFRDKVKFEFGDDGDWDGAHPQISIWYERLETDEELAARERSAYESAVRDLNYKRSQLAMLKAELGES